MPEPFLERLSRFTPDGGGLDRDALLFAAGRGSARANGGWKAIATLLAASQVLSLVLLWPQRVPPGGGLSVAVNDLEVRPADRESVSHASAQVGSGVWSVRGSLLQAEAEERPSAAITFIDSDPPLRTLGPPPASLVN
jgi:hypothetical protein